MWWQRDKCPYTQSMARSRDHVGECRTIPAFSGCTFLDFKALKCSGVFHAGVPVFPGARKIAETYFRKWRANQSFSRVSLLYRTSFFCDRFSAFDGDHFTGPKISAPRFSSGTVRLMFPDRVGYQNITLAVGMRVYPDRHIE